MKRDFMKGWQKDYWFSVNLAMELIIVFFLGLGGFRFGAGKNSPGIPEISQTLGALYPETSDLSFRIAGLLLGVAAVIIARFLHTPTQFERASYTAIFMLCAIAGYLL
ncbi:MAG TPA: hypothetical protein VEA59_02950 [Patescibacteria group bacterium]|nr:hypothetical protein [Patescibacteria group bacterium]